MNNNEEQVNLNVQQQMIKSPIFLGCNDPEIVNKINDLVKEDERFEVAVMSQEVLKVSTENWFLSRMNLDQANKQIEVRNNKESAESALKYANELFDHFPKRNGFRIWELRNYFNLNRFKLTKGKFPNVKMSPKEVNAIADFLIIHRFLTPTILDAAINSQLFVITIDSVSRIKYLKLLKNRIDEIISERKYEIDYIENEIDELSKPFLKEIEEIELENNVEKGTEEGDLQQTTDFLNDKHGKDIAHNNGEQI